MTTTESTPNGPRRLERSRDDRVIAGVCGGIARYFDVDVTLVRVVGVALLAFGGFGAFLYLAAWLLMPERGSTRPLLGREERRSVRIAAIVVLGIVGVAAVGAWADFGFVFGGWPLLLLVTAGAAIWFIHERGDTSVPVSPTAWPGSPAASSAASGASAASAGPAASAAPAASAGPAASRAPAASAASAAPAADATSATTSALPVEPAGPAGDAPASGTGGPTAARFGADPDAPTLAADASGQPPSGPPPDAPPPRQRRRRASWGVTALAAGAVCLVVAAAGALDAADVVDLGWGGMIAITIVTIGTALIASAFFGGARGLIPVGLLLAALLGGAAATGVSLNGGVGERDYRVTDGDLLRGRYELGIGHLQLDLRGIELARGVTHVSTDLDIGMLEIVAPGARIEDGDASLRGDEDGRGEGGIDVRRTIVVGSGHRRLEIDAHVGAGLIAVSARPGGEEWDWSKRAPARPATAPARPATAPASRRHACIALAFAAAQSGCEGGRDAA